MIPRSHDILLDIFGGILTIIPRSHDILLDIFVDILTMIPSLCTQSDSNIGAAIERCMKAATAFEKALDSLLFRWMRNDHVGHFNSSISNVGTGMFVSIQLKLPPIAVKQVNSTDRTVRQEEG